MTPYRSIVGVGLMAAVVSVLAAACGGGNGGSPPPTSTPVPAPTATRTAVPTPTTAAGGVSALLVLNQNVTASGSDALGAPPQQWRESPDSGSFDRSLAAANWSIDGAGDKQGVTGPDGRFTTGPLSPGPHTLQVAKTLDGNLASFSVPFTVGDDGGSEVVVEVSWGQAKSISTYMHDGSQWRDTHGPGGNWVNISDGRISAFGNGVRTYTDADGDGLFDVAPCGPEPVTCANNDPQCTDFANCPCTPVCLTCTHAPYPCGADGTCTQAGDLCVCAPSCVGCKDCGQRVCASGCAPVRIMAITVTTALPIPLTVGQQQMLAAAFRLSSGNEFDLTAIADWHSSDGAVASIDSWGQVTALAAGTTELTASVGSLSSAALPLSVVARPPLRKIHIQNVSCIFPLGAPAVDAGVAEALPPTGVRTDILPVPNCGEVIQVGGTLQFRAIGEFDNGYYQDISDEVRWQVVPPEVGSVVAGLFTALHEGTAALTAALDSVVSDAAKIRVVTQASVVALSIYADNGGFAVLAGGAAPAPVASGMPCYTAEAAATSAGAPCCCPGPLAGASAAPCRCNYALNVLRGDRLQFHATAQYDTGAWKDVTKLATWGSSDASVASIDTAGVMTAVRAGDAFINAVFDGVTSDPADIRVVDQATLQSLFIYQEGADRVVAKGEQRFFHANGSYDIGISRDVTKEAVWRSSDDGVGGFDSPGVFSARAAGTVQVWAELDGERSNLWSLEVYATSALTYCDPSRINRAVWSDDFNRVTLESDCAFYSQPGIATVRYSVTEIQPHGGIFSPCLDLYVFAAKTKVRTIREQGCGDPFLPAAAVGRDQEVLKYQLRAFWDLKDEAGTLVAPGAYTIYGRFYLYYDPVVSIEVTVLAPGHETPTPGGATLAPGSATPTPSPGPVCTPPLCASDETFYCPGVCPGGCGTTCATRPPTPPSDGGFTPTPPPALPPPSLPPELATTPTPTAAKL